MAEHRYSREGVGKVVEEQKWGRDKARERYGALKYEDGASRPADKHLPQDPVDRHGPKYENRTPDNWLRGFGRNGIESAEGKPNFKPGYKGKDK